MALLQVIVERVSSSKAEVVLSCLQLHWSSFTGWQILAISPFWHSGQFASYLFLRPGLLHYSLCNASTSGSTLRAHSLRLFCSLLVHRFQPDTGRTAGTSGTTNSSREPLAAALRHLLDGKEEHRPGGSREEEDRTTSSLGTDSGSETSEQLTTTPSHEVKSLILLHNSLLSSWGLFILMEMCSFHQEVPATGSVLCEALLKARDGTFGRMPMQTQGKLSSEGRQLVGESLGVLLACSTAAKQTALSGELSNLLLLSWVKTEMLWCV